MDSSRGKTGKRLLVVEDEALVAEEIRDRLRRLDYEVLSIADNAEQAISLARDYRPDLVLMDIRLKGKLDGIEAAERIYRLYGIPVVYMTAHSDAATLQRASATAQFGYLLKPVKETDMVIALQVAFNRHHAEVRLRSSHLGFDAILGSISEAVIAMDARGGVKYMNPAAEQLCGRTAAEAQDAPIEEVLRLHDPGRNSIGIHPVRQMLLVGESLLSRRPWIVESGGGTPVPADLSATPVHNLLGQLAGGVVTLRDISDLRRSEDRFREFLEQAPDATVIVDESGVISVVNRETERMFGYSRQDLIGKSIEILVPNRLQSAHSGHRLAFMNTPRNRQMGMGAQLFGMRRDGTEFPVEISLGQIHYEQRTSIACSVRDVTEKRRAEGIMRDIADALNTATGPDFFRTLALRLANACQVDQVMISMFDVEMPDLARTIAMVQEGVVLPNFSYALRGTPCEDTREWSMCHIKEDAAQKYPLDLALAKMGVTAYLGITLVDSRGHAIGLIALMNSKEIERATEAENILRLVSARAGAELERERTEQALQQAREDWEQSFDAISSLIAVLDEHGAVVRANTAMRNSLSGHFRQVEGLQFSDLMGGCQSSLIAEFDSALRSSSILKREVLLKQPAGLFAVSLYPLRLSKPARAVLLMNDITKQVEIADQLRQSQKMHAIGQLAGGVAHDFNNLLTVINSYGELLAAELDCGSPETEEAITAIRDAGRRGAQLTRQLLLFGRKAFTQQSAVNLNDLVEHTVALLRRLIGEEYVVTLALSPDLPDCLADGGQLEQVIMNLCLNARDAMPRGGQILITTRKVMVSQEECLSHPGCEPGTYVRLDVADTGEGIAEDIREHLFEPFFTTKGPGKGTGLGLATAHGIVVASKGFMSASSTAGNGATFTVHLPAHGNQQQRAVPEALPSVFPNQGECLLLVEDEEAVRKVAATALRQAGYRVIEAESAEAALQLPADTLKSVALLISDIVMPGLSGTDLTAALRKNLPALKVLYVTGYSGDDKKPGEDKVLQKPFTPASLAEAVRQALGG